MKVNALKFFKDHLDVCLFSVFAYWPLLAGQTHLRNSRTRMILVSSHWPITLLFSFDYQFHGDTLLIGSSVGEIFF